MTSTVRSPLAGELLALDQVADPVFAAGIVGPGLAVRPAEGPCAPVEVLAPVTGPIAKLHPHAFVQVTGSGQGVLVHLGIDTVTLRGAGFEVLVAEGGTVTAGTPVLRYDVDAVRQAGRDPVVLVVALDVRAEQVSVRRVGGSVDVGADLFGID